MRKQLLAKRTYSDKEKERVYKEILEQAKRAIKESANVVLDATFYKSDPRKMFLDEIKNQSTLFFIEVRADEDIIRQRLQKERPYSDADFKVYKLIRQQWEPVNEPHLILNSTDDNINQMLDKAMEHLQKTDDKRSSQ